MTNILTSSESGVKGLSLLHSGKVRDVYEVDGDRLLLVATDRLSAFDCILPTPIRDKGAVLTALSVFWFNRLGGLTDHHLMTADFDEMPDIVRQNENLRLRSMLVRKTRVFPVECVVRGYLEGSGWKDYQANGEICGHKLPAGLRQCDRLPEPIFTPSTKAAKGHDENITEAEFTALLGEETAGELRSRALSIYKTACEYALSRGIIIADTKFEFGLDREGRILLIDEVLTPDSSRFWAAETYSPGHAQPSFDKQYVREYLETLDWNKQYPTPALPDEIAEATRRRYLQAYKLITGEELAGG
jgi:phosphoribosylaminoimidazole-succinocarboxamide synthase